MHAESKPALPPLLLTSSVVVSAPATVLSDPVRRAELTLTSVEKWLEVAPGVRIVLCDGSGYDFTAVCAERFPGAAIECLSFRNDADAVSRFGKGYGEGEIVHYALQNSRVLGDAPSFAKCTSKWWVENFGVLAKEWVGPFQSSCRFKHKNSVRKIRAAHIETLFYIADKSFYRDRLLGVHTRVRDHEGYYLEHSFKDALIASNADVLRYSFRTTPRILGVSGTSGLAHKGGYEALERVFKHSYRRLLVQLNQRFFAG